MPNFRYDWERVLRRAQLPSSTKLVGFTLGTYANSDGTRARPSLDRLVATTSTSRSTVIRALAQLRDVGLISRVFAGSKAGRRGLADEYHLIIPDDLLDRVRMLPPDELTGPNQVLDVTPDPVASDVGTGTPPDTCSQPEQVHEMTPDRGETGVTSDHEQVSPRTEQVSPRAGTGIPGDTPPEQDQPETRTQHQQPGSHLSHSPHDPAVAAATATLAALAADHQQQLLDDARQHLGNATGTELICYAADLHHRQQRSNGARPSTTTRLLDRTPDEPPF